MFWLNPLGRPSINPYSACVFSSIWQVDLHFSHDFSSPEASFSRPSASYLMGENDTRSENRILICIASETVLFLCLMFCYYKSSINHFSLKNRSPSRKEPLMVLCHYPKTVCKKWGHYYKMSIRLYNYKFILYSRIKVLAASTSKFMNFSTVNFLWLRYIYLWKGNKIS